MKGRNIVLSFIFAIPTIYGISKHLAPYGAKNFPDHYSEAVDAYFTAEKLVRAGQYGRASEILTAFWAKYPQGNAAWQQLPQQAGGIFTGHPPAYASLQMLTKIAETFAQGLPRPRETLAFTVVLPQNSTGFDPANEQELRDNRGTPVTHHLDPRISAGKYRAVDESLWLFQEYLGALTGGEARFTVRYVPLKISIPIVTGTSSKGTITSRPADEGYRQIWASIGAQVRQRTDFWMIVYPSHKPENAALRESLYITGGGMGRGPDGSPCIIVDDMFLLRAQPHFKVAEKDFDALERRLYLPQFMQHEFFHYLFAMYPEFGLEAESHQWHQRSAWPSDFQGIVESDYYQESFEKRIRAAAVPTIAKLRFQGPQDNLLRAIEPAQIAGRYSREPVQNGWHNGTITVGENSLLWKNTAGALWNLQWNQKGELITGDDNPYFKSNPASGRSFRIRLKRDAAGKYTTAIDGFMFQDEFYRKVE